MKEKNNGGKSIFGGLETIGCITIPLLLAAVGYYHELFTSIDFVVQVGYVCGTLLPVAICIAIYYAFIYGKDES